MTVRATLLPFSTHSLDLTVCAVKRLRRLQRSARFLRQATLRSRCIRLIEKCMNEDARLQLKWIIDQISPGDQRMIAELSQEGVLSRLHHGLGTQIRNRMRSGELNALVPWSSTRMPTKTKNLDALSKPIIL